MILGASGGYLLIVIFAAAVVLQSNLSSMWVGLAICLFWALAPLAVRWSDQPVAEDVQRLDPMEEEQLRGLAEQISVFMKIMPGPKITFYPRTMSKSSLLTEWRIARRQRISDFC